jgi:hypothetical protein
MRTPESLESQRGTSIESTDSQFLVKFLQERSRTERYPTMKFLYLLLATAAVNAFAFVSPSNQRKNLPSVANKAELTRKNSNSNKGGHMDRPPLLDGSLAGDRGFDPLGFITSKEDLIWYREAEMKHARLAMLVRVRRGAQRRSATRHHAKVAVLLTLFPLFPR